MKFKVLENKKGIELTLNAVAIAILVVLVIVIVVVIASKFFSSSVKTTNSCEEKGGTCTVGKFCTNTYPVYGKCDTGKVCCKLENT